MRNPLVSGSADILSAFGWLFCPNKFLTSKVIQAIHPLEYGQDVRVPRKVRHLRKLVYNDERIAWERESLSSLVSHQK